MTSAHAQAADVFYFAAALLFVAKFLTWEETSRQAPVKKTALQSVAVLLTVTSAIALFRWNHAINRPPTPAAPTPVSGDTPGSKGPDQTLASGQPQHPAGVQSAAPTVPDDDPEPDSPLGRAVIKFFSYRLPAAKHNGPCVPNNAHPYQCVATAVLSQKLLEEAAKVQAVSGKYPDANPTMIDRQNFTREIQTCCWKDMIDLRYAAFDRLGPAAQSKDEERAWENIALYEKSPMKTLNPRQLTSYTRYFTEWGSDLQGGPVTTVRTVGFHTRCVEAADFAKAHVNAVSTILGVAVVAFVC